MDREDFLKFLAFLVMIGLVWLVVTVPLALLVIATTSLQGTAAFHVVELAIAVPLLAVIIFWWFWSTRSLKTSSS